MLRLVTKKVSRSWLVQLQVETSDYISKKLVAAGVPHEVLNAKNHYKKKPKSS